MWCCSRGSGSAFLSKISRTLPKNRAIANSPPRLEAPISERFRSATRTCGCFQALDSGKLAQHFTMERTVPIRPILHGHRFETTSPVGKRRGGLAARLISGSCLEVLVDDFSQPRCCRLSESCLRKPCIKRIDLTDLAQPEHRRLSTSVVKAGGELLSYSPVQQKNFRSGNF